MARGGRRQGTPGKAYANRTDLAMRPDMDKNTAASGGIVAPTPVPAPQASYRSPDESPMLSDPTMRPGEPITAGLSTGPGAGPEALGIDPREAETRQMRKWMPLIAPIVDEPDTPDSVKMLFRYMRSA